HGDDAHPGVVLGALDHAPEVLTLFVVLERRCSLVGVDAEDLEAQLVPEVTLQPAALLLQAVAAVGLLLLAHSQVQEDTPALLGLAVERGELDAHAVSL